MSSPGPEVGGSPKASQELSREANLIGASARDDNPTAYGFFSTIPSPTRINDALSELIYAFDELKADGVVLMTSYDGKYLGHPDFVPLWDELNNRKAVIFIHPTTAQATSVPNKAMLAPIIDFTFETTKTAVDLILSGTFASHAKNCKIILSHAGGTLPFLTPRAAHLLYSFKLTEIPDQEFIEQAKSFYFDTALSGMPPQMRLLLEFAKPGHVLFGSDTPYADDDTIIAFTKAFDGMKLSDEEMKAINRDNALKLFPRLAK